MSAPLAFNHIGITVPDIDRAIDWYRSVMGFQLIVRRLMQYQPQIPEVREIFGPRFACAHQAHLLSANGVGIELFQFLDPPVVAQDDNFQYWRTGIFHLCSPIRPRRTGGADRRGRRTSAIQNLDLPAGASLSARLLRRPVRNHHRGLLPLLRGDVLEHARLGVRPAAGADWVSPFNGGRGRAARCGNRCARSELPAVSA